MYFGDVDVAEALLHVFIDDKSPHVYATIFVQVLSANRNVSSFIFTPLWKWMSEIVKSTIDFLVCLGKIFGEIKDVVKVIKEMKQIQLG